jgi:nicotinamidase-related amidase
MDIAFISVDMQNDFVSEGGIWYQRKECAAFFRDSVVPVLRSSGRKVQSITSDYSLPRANGSRSYCVPGQWGGQSVVPADVTQFTWVKAARSPIWVRDQSGVEPRPEPRRFTDWLHESVGPPSPQLHVCVMGVALECCVLCVVQELYFRGYRVRLVPEAVDTESGDTAEKDFCLRLLFRLWASPLLWPDLVAAL